MKKRTDNSEERRSDLTQQLVGLLPAMDKQAMILTRSPETAGDLVQDTCDKVLERLDQWQGTGRFGGWVAAVMENIWRQNRRKKKQRGEEELPEPDQVMVAGMESEVLARDMLVAMGAEVSSFDLSLLIKLRLYGYTNRELAEELGIPRDTVWTKARRAIEALRKAGWTVKGPPE